VRKESLAVLVVLSTAGASAPGGEATEMPELARMIQKAVVDQLPKQFEDRSEWGATALPPARPIAPRLRARAEAANGQELPHGLWRRTSLWFDDPAKDVRIRVFKLPPGNGKLMRLRIEATAALHGERQRQRWRYGAKLFDITARADAVVGVTLDCDVTTSLDASKLPPTLRVEAEVDRVRLSLREFNLLRVGNLLQGPDALAVGDELKGALEDLLRSREPEVKDFANRMIAKGIDVDQVPLLVGSVNVKITAPRERKDDGRAIAPPAGTR
jgi:hypothetical protein